MDGRVHAAGAGLAGAAAAAVAFQGGWADTWGEAALLGALCSAAALFPDLDTASHPQRWAARALVVGLGWLAWSGQWREAALIGFAALLPLVAHHRGWTHRWWAVPVAPLGALLLWQAITGGGHGWASGGDILRGAVSGVREHLPAYVAMCAGFALHLCLDRSRRRVRRR